ncbi:L-serine ammonia-lyase [Spartinivicinus poritis]|uniref:L-serine ammonia-lyase n=1 Tax=Spartinivicinus poritis TaxID=2994640 RepID=UPI00237CC595|nr:L-serine ammonia-lyase [Spartinivicinus sp. A2-2]
MSENSILSIFDLFKIGIGPSSSHTVGPMWAVYRFLADSKDCLDQVSKVKVALYGSLALTGKGHGTDTAVLLGLLGERPDQVDPQQVAAKLDEISATHRLMLAGKHEITFNPDQAIEFHNETFLPEHPNGIALSLYDANGLVLHHDQFFSVGGGFVVSKDELSATAPVTTDIEVPFPFHTGEELLKLCKQHNLSIAQLVFANEEVLQGSMAAVEQQLETTWQVFHDCIERGCRTEGVLPGGLNVQRRAPKLHKELCSRPEDSLKDPLTVMDWISLFALAVNEENAAGGRVVTAPTNGAAGVIPAVLSYYMRFVPGSNQQGLYDFLATAAAIGMLYKKNASISAAEVGCQGEIGVACSMAAGALAAVLGGSAEQVENAAEIGMEHSLGMTCDPIGGLVQIPCIERNTMGAVKAVNAARLALRGDGTHRVALDSVIETMRQTGMDMQSKYKETALGGLAVNVVLC